MTRFRFGLVAGLVFAALDLVPMIFMDDPNKVVAMTAAFIDRFALGLLIPNVSLPFGDILNGVLLGLLLSLPSALITGAYAPILGIGIIGGLVIGILTRRYCRPARQIQNVE